MKKPPGRAPWADSVLRGKGKRKPPCQSNSVNEERFPPDLMVTIAGGFDGVVFHAATELPMAVEDGDRVGIYRLVEVQKVRVVRTCDTLYKVEEPG